LQNFAVDAAKKQNYAVRGFLKPCRLKENLYETNAPQARFFMKQNAPQARPIK